PLIDLLDHAEPPVDADRARHRRAQRRRARGRAGYPLEADRRHAEAVHGHFISSASGSSSSASFPADAPRADAGASAGLAAATAAGGAATSVAPAAPFASSAAYS